MLFCFCFFVFCFLFCFGFALSFFWQLQKIESIACFRMFSIVCLMKFSVSFFCLFWVSRYVLLLCRPGENGYIFLEFGKNTCGIANMATVLWKIYVPGVSRGCFLEVFKYLSASKKHSFETPGCLLLKHLFASVFNLLEELLVFSFLCGENSCGLIRVIFGFVGKDFF